MTEQAKKRRYQDTLGIAGTGVIAFSVWSLAKIGLFLTFTDQDVLRSLLGITGAMLANAVLVVVAGMGLVDLCIRVYVGLSARAEGRGERRNPFYLVVAAVAAIVNAMTLIVTVMGASSAVTIPYVLVSGAIEATAFAALLMVIYSSIRLRHMSKTTE
jgi:hypothetical protein